MALPQLSQFMAATRQMESGGNYRATGPSTRYGRATGGYQFLDSTWGGYGGFRSARDAPPHVQDQRAAQLMTQYYNQFGRWDLVAVAWHAGPGKAQEVARTGQITGGDVNMSTQDYVTRVMGLMGSGGGGGGIGGIGAAVGSAMAGGGDFYGGGTSLTGDLGFYEMNEEEASARAKELYGYLGWFVDHPEVGPVLLQGAKEGWSSERLQGALVKTNWWKKHNESQRQFQALQASDPATAWRRYRETELSVRQEAARLGIPMSQKRLFIISAAALTNQWTEEEMQLALSAEMRWDPRSSERGEVGRIMQSVRQLASEYMVPMTRQQEWQWARRMVSGAASPEAVQTSLQKLARSRFPHLAEQIDSGVTPGQFFQPYRNQIAQLLEVSPDSIDLSSPEWQEVTSYRDTKSSQVRPMTIQEAGLKARRRNEWANTQNGRQSIAETAGSLGSLFGQ